MIFLQCWLFLATLYISKSGSVDTLWCNFLFLFFFLGLWCCILRFATRHAVVCEAAISVIGYCFMNKMRVFLQINKTALLFGVADGVIIAGEPHFKRCCDLAEHIPNLLSPHFAIANLDPSSVRGLFINKVFAMFVTSFFIDEHRNSEIFKRCYLFLSTLNSVLFYCVKFRIFNIIEHLFAMHDNMKGLSQKSYCPLTRSYLMTCLLWYIIQLENVGYSVLGKRAWNYKVW